MIGKILGFQRFQPACSRRLGRRCIEGLPRENAVFWHIALKETAALPKPDRGKTNDQLVFIQGYEMS